MKLSAWMKLQNVSDAGVGKRLCVSPTTIGRIRRGLTYPEAALALKIIEMTKGSVTPDDHLCVYAECRGINYAQGGD